MLLNQDYCDTLALKVYNGIRSVPGGLEVLLLNVGQIVPDDMGPEIVDGEGWLTVAKEISSNLNETYDAVFGELGSDPGSATHNPVYVEGIVSISPGPSVIEQYGLDVNTDIVFTASEIELINRGLYTAQSGILVNQETDYLRAGNEVTYKLNKVIPLNIQLLRPIMFVFSGTRSGPEPEILNGA